MLIYSVSCTMAASLADEWQQFFLDKHLDDVVNTGYFTSYSFRKVYTEEKSDTITFIAEYECPSPKHLAQYNANAAPAMKQDVISRFGGQFTASRTIYELIK